MLARLLRFEGVYFKVGM